MATSVQQDPVRISPAADIVGNAFVNQYYHLLHENPKLVHRFYRDVSKLYRPGKNGVMDITTTMEDINEKILSMKYDEFSAEIISVDAQKSYGGAVLILVTGFLMGKDHMRQKFTQCFFLAPQEKGYFVLNDVFRYVDQNGNQGFVDDVESPLTPDNGADPSVQQVQGPEQIIVTAEDVDRKHLYHPENGQASIEEEDAPVPEVIDEIPEGSIEEVPKKLYGSIVLKESGAPTFTATTAVRSVPKSQDQQTAAVPPPPKVSETNGSSTNANKNGNKPENEAEGYSIFVKGLPFNATPPLLDGIFKKFGPIKNDGIQIRTQKRFCFGFVEFEVAGAVQSALEASPIWINGRSVVVKAKRSTNKGSKRGRFPSGRGLGYRNEGPKGPGNYGNGRSYGRSDFNSRGEFGYGNGNRGGDGYQRVNQNGARGGRVNRTGGLVVNSTAKTKSVRVPAPA